jgi:hypothetical protein
LKIIKLYAKSKSDPCWKDFEQLGTKEKDGRIVPNCIPIESDSESDLPVSFNQNTLDEVPKNDYKRFLKRARDVSR